MLALKVARLENNVHARVDIVILIAPAAKKAFLIILSAMNGRSTDKSTVDAAIEGASLRLRAMMTSFAFIPGLLPLVTAAAAGGPPSCVGTSVFGGMLASAIVGILLMPGLHVIFQTLCGKIKDFCGNKKKPETAAQ